MAQTLPVPPNSNNIVRLAMATLGFFTVSWLILDFSNFSGHAGAWHGFGLALALLLRFGIPLWPGVMLGSLLATLACGISVASATSLAFGNTLGALAGAWLFQRQGLDTKLDHLKDYLGLVIIGALFTPFLSATFDIGIPFLAGDLANQNIRHAWLENWIADSLGVLTTAPILLLWLNRGPIYLSAQHWLGLGVLTGLTVLFSAALFFGWQHEIFGEYIRGYLVLPLLVWAAIGFGRRITALGGIILFALSMNSMQYNTGLFAHGNQTAPLDQLWIFVSISSVTGMSLAMVFFELRKTQKALRENAANFRTLAESSMALIWMSDTSNKAIWFNRAWLEFTGRKAEQEIGNGWCEGIHEEDVERYLSTRNEAFAARRAFETEYRLRHHSGRYRFIVDHGAPRLDDNGDFLGYTGSCWDITERYEAEQALVERERMLRAIYDNSNVAIGFVSTEGRITHANRHLAELFGFTLEEVIGMNYYEHVHPEDRELSHKNINALTSNQIDLADVERHYLRKDGSEFWGHLTSRRMCDESGRMLGLVGVITDITAHKAADAQLRLAAQVFESSHEGIVIINAENRIVSVNQAFTKITGYTTEEAIGQASDMLRSNKHTENSYTALVQQLFETGHWDGEVWNYHKDGSLFPVWASISVVHDEHGAIEKYIGMFTDITERKSTEDRIRHLAQYDFLTDLPNRALLFDRLTREFFEARRYDKRFALLFIDLDKFKPVNDQYGHAAGDLLLCEVAHRLADNVRDSDTVSRQGGDEFIILVPELPESEQVVQLGMKLLRILGETYLIDGHELNITPSIGIAVYPDDGEDIDTLLKNADTAMYRAKNAGRNNLKCYSAELNTLARKLSS